MVSPGDSAAVHESAYGGRSTTRTVPSVHWEHSSVSLVLSHWQKMAFSISRSVRRSCHRRSFLTGMQTHAQTMSGCVQASRLPALAPMI